MPRTNAPASERVVEQVAENTDSDTLDLPPLYDAVDPDALNAVVSGLSDGQVEFAYAGYDVTVYGDGSIALDERPTGNTTAEAVADA